MTNPWNLTPREAEVLTAMAETGLDKLVADRLGITQQRVSQIMRSAMDRIGVRTPMQAVVAYDRWSQRVNLKLAAKLHRAATDARVARVTTEAR